MTSVDRFLIGLVQSYKSVSGSELTTLETLKRCAVDLLTSSINSDATVGVIREVDLRIVLSVGESSSSSSSSILSTSTASTTTTAIDTAKIVKLLNDDIATLRRIGRVPDAKGINAKALLLSGKCQSFDFAANMLIFYCWYCDFQNLYLI